MLPNVRHVLLCDKNGETLGTMDVPKAHEGEGKLHRAFSIFIFKKDTHELLIQQRNKDKNLFPLLWANTCCSHPQEGEDLIESGKKRLKEELGFSCDLEPKSSFVYQAEDPNGNGAEHEYDTILVGEIDDNTEIKPNAEEVADWRWIAAEELCKELDEKPDTFGPWFPIALNILFGENNG